LASLFSSETLLTVTERKTMPLPDFEGAARTLRAAQPLRNEIEKNVFLAGGWEADAVDRIMSDFSDEINVADDGTISGVQAAVERFRQSNPDGFIKLEGQAKSENATASKRLYESYKQIMKVRDRKGKLESQTSRIMERVNRNHARLTGRRST
jgi:hypothetical protein